MNEGNAVATFAFADLAGFTALTEAHGDERAADLAGECCRLIRARLSEGSEEVKTIGERRLKNVTGAIKVFEAVRGPRQDHVAIDPVCRMTCTAPTTREPTYGSLAVSKRQTAPRVRHIGRGRARASTAVVLGANPNHSQEAPEEAHPHQHRRRDRVVPRARRDRLRRHQAGQELGQLEGDQERVGHRQGT